MRFLFLFLCFSSLLVAQKPNAWYHKAKKEGQHQQWKNSLEYIQKALEQKPEKIKFLEWRAQTYEALFDQKLALQDYQKLLGLKKKETYFLKAIDLALHLNNFPLSLSLCDQFLLQEKHHIQTLQNKAWSHFMLRQFKEASATMDHAIERNYYNHRTHYLKAYALDSLHEYKAAIEHYNRAITLLKGEGENQNIPLPMYKPYFSQLAIVYYKTLSYDDALKNFQIALDVDKTDKISPYNFFIYYLRSYAYLEKGDFTNALSDLNRSNDINKKHLPTLMQRGRIFKRTSQYHSAINDFSLVLIQDPNNTEALVESGKCYMELADFKNAGEKLQKALDLNPKDVSIRKLHQEANAKWYETNRESDPPKIRLIFPQPDGENFVNVYTTQENIIIEADINDKSKIASITINGRLIPFNHNELNPGFVANIPLMGEDNINIEVKDIYQNTSNKSFRLGKLVNSAAFQVKMEGFLMSASKEGKIFPNRKIFLTNEKGEIIYSTQSDEKGYFQFEKLPFDRSYLFTIDTTSLDKTETGFVILNKQKETAFVSLKNEKGQFLFRLLKSDESSLSLMTVDDAPLHIDVKGKLLSADREKMPIPNIVLQLIDQNGKIIASQTTNAEGFFAFTNLPLGIQYLFRIPAEEAIKLQHAKLIITDEKGRLVKEINRNENGLFIFQLLPADKIQLSSIAVEDSDPWMKALKLDVKKSELQIIESIYYESGSFQISESSYPILDKAANALLQNNSLVLEIQSHTDAVASDDYNMDLSQKRAQAVVDYLCKKGIDKKRLSALGLGETQICNRCKNGVECSDEEHKQNRRTVFKLNYKI